MPHPNFRTQSARECGRKHTAWGEALAEPQELNENNPKPANAGDSDLQDIRLDLSTVLLPPMFQGCGALRSTLGFMPAPAFAG